MEKELLEYLRETKKKIVLYGMGNGADKIMDILNEYGIEISGVFATNSFVRDKTFRGFKLTNYSLLKENFGDMIILLAFGSNRPEVFENIDFLRSEQEFYVPDVPVYGGGLFTLKFAKENEAKLKEIYSLLADEKSKQTFENIINYKISGKPEYLFDCEVSPNEPYDSFFKIKNDETFIDLGAYNGDTVKEFADNCKGKYTKIIAVEPDSKSYEKLKRNTQDLENISYYNACVTDKSGTALFTMKQGRGSSLGKGIEIPAVSVDDILKGEEATYIKYDVEGEEINAIKGAKNTIAKFKPKMLISAYHRTDDLITIPNEVLSIRNDYKIYLRHYPYLPAWDTNYYFI